MFGGSEVTLNGKPANLGCPLKKTSPNVSKQKRTSFHGSPPGFPNLPWAATGSRLAVLDKYAHAPWMKTGCVWFAQKGTRAQVSGTKFQ